MLHVFSYCYSCFTIVASAVLQKNSVNHQILSFQYCGTPRKSCSGHRIWQVTGYGVSLGLSNGPISVQTALAGLQHMSTQVRQVLFWWQVTYCSSTFQQIANITSMCFFFPMYCNSGSETKVSTVRQVSCHRVLKTQCRAAGH